MALSVKEFKVYMPAKDFEKSKRFYQALGFKMSEGWGGTADFELNGCSFRLQDYYVKEWAENFMVKIGVDDIKAWHRARVSLPRVASSTTLASSRPKLSRLSLFCTWSIHPACCLFSCNKLFQGRESQSRAAQGPSPALSPTWRAFPAPCGRMAAWLASCELGSRPCAGFFA